MKEPLRRLFVFGGTVLLLVYMFQCLSDQGTDADASVAIVAIANLNHVLLNRTATDPNFVPAEDFWSMIKQLGADPYEMATQLQYGTLYYRGGRLDFGKETVRFLYASDFGSAAYFADGSNSEFSLSSKVSLSKIGETMLKK
jgi:hypothetical protein